jgi:hypothetical protein
VGESKLMKTKFLAFTSVALLLTYGISALAQLPPEARAGLWKAQWITSPSAPQWDIVVLHFRKVIEIPRAPEHFVVHVSADSQFILCVNQREVGRGPARSDLAHWKYETYDLAAFLRPGRNEIAATVWSLGVSTGAQISDRTAFVLRGDSSEESVADTDTSWEVEEDKGVQTLPTPPDIQRFYYVAEPAERIDGSLFDWSWNDATSRGKWEKAAPIGNASERGAVLQNNNWQLMPNSLPAMQMELTPVGRVVRSSGVEPPANFPGAGFEIPAHATVSLLLDQSHLTTAYPELTVSGGAKSTIRLTYAEALVDSQGVKGNRNEIAGKHIVGIFDEFLPDGSEKRPFVPLAWRTWRYLQLDVNTADQPLRIENLRSWFTAFPFEERARFQSDDPTLSQIWQIGWRTARLDAHDTYMDTPYWERMQYIGDTRIQALISYALPATIGLLAKRFKPLMIPESRTASPAVAIRHRLRRSFPRSRCCGSEWCMTSGGIAETRDLLKRKFPAQGPCWTGSSTGRDQTDSSDTWTGGPSSIGEKTSPSVCRPKMRAADLLPSRFNLLRRFVTAQSWNQPWETRLARNAIGKPKAARQMRSANCVGIIPMV